MEIEVDENGTLDLSMKKPIKKEAGVSCASPVRSPDLSSSSSSSSLHHGNSSISPHSLHAYKQEVWEGPLDYTKPNRQREEELEEVDFLFIYTIDTQVAFNHQTHFSHRVCNVCLLIFTQMDHSAHSFASSDPEDCDMMQDVLEDRKYPGEVTTPSFKVRFQPKDTKKELLM